MRTYLAAHVVSILSITFFFSICPWILKLIDKTVPSEKKQRFNQWMGTLIPNMDSWTIDAILESSSRCEGAFMIMEVIVACLLVYGVIPYVRMIPGMDYGITYQSLLLMPILIVPPVFVLIAFFWIAYKFARLWPERREKIFVRSFELLIRCLFMVWVGMTILYFISCLLATRMTGRFETELSHILIARGFVTAYIRIWFEIALVFMCMYLPAILLSLLRKLVEWFTRCVRWVASYPQGAWAAMIIAIGTAIDLIRLIIK
jgi:hypothetical protein